MPVWLKTTLRGGASFQRRLTSLMRLNYWHQLWNFVLNIVTLTCNQVSTKAYLFIFFTDILRRKLKYNWVNICNRVLVHRVNKLVRLIRVFPLAWLTKYTVFTFPFPGSGSLLWIFPSEYSSHWFQIILDQIRLTFSVATGTKSTNAIKYSPGITAVLGNHAHERIK